MAFPPKRIRIPEEIDDESYCPEASKVMPCCTYRGCCGAPCCACWSCSNTNLGCKAMDGLFAAQFVCGWNCCVFLLCTSFSFGFRGVLNGILQALVTLIVFTIRRGEGIGGGIVAGGFGFRSCVHVLGLILRTQRLRIIKHHWHPSCHAPLLSGSYSVNRLHNSSRAGWTNACLNKRLMTAEGGLSAVYRPCGQGNAVSDLSVCDHALHCCGRYPTQAGKFPIGIFNVFGIAAGNRDSRNGDVIAQYAGIGVNMLQNRYLTGGNMHSSFFGKLADSGTNGGLSLLCHSTWELPRPLLRGDSPMAGNQKNGVTVFVWLFHDANSAGSAVLYGCHMEL